MLVLFYVIKKKRSVHFQAYVGVESEVQELC